MRRLIAWIFILFHLRIFLIGVCTFYSNLERCNKDDVQSWQNTAQRLAIGCRGPPGADRAYVGRNQERETEANDFDEAQPGSVLGAVEGRRQTASAASNGSTANNTNVRDTKPAWMIV